MQRQMAHDGWMKPGEYGPGIQMVDGDDDCARFLGICCDEERAFVGPASPVIAHPQVGVLLGGKIGGRMTQGGLADVGSSVLAVAGRSEKFVDYLTGQPLPPDLCREARRVEIQYFRDKGVWDIRSIQEALRVTGRKPISIRWVEVNKADHDNPKIRSRLVAREIRGPGQEPCFAPTPPLESLRMMLSYAVTDIAGQEPKCWSPSSPKRMQISLVDVLRASILTRRPTMPTQLMSTFLSRLGSRQVRVLF